MIKDPEHAIYCSDGLGPIFGHKMLCYYNEPFDGRDNCRCSHTRDMFEIADNDGNNLLIGGTRKKFTAAEIEVF